MINSIKKFVGDVSAEMKKVSWSSREQLKESTIVVLIVTAILSIVVLAMDTMVGFIIDKIF